MGADVYDALENGSVSVGTKTTYSGDTEKIKHTLPCVSNHGSSNGGSSVDSIGFRKILVSTLTGPVALEPNALAACQSLVHCLYTVFEESWGVRWGEGAI